jgi:hypothetical protein
LNDLREEVTFVLGRLPSRWAGQKIHKVIDDVNGAATLRHNINPGTNTSVSNIQSSSIHLRLDLWYDAWER